MKKQEEVKDLIAKKLKLLEAVRAVDLKLGGLVSGQAIGGGPGPDQPPLCVACHTTCAVCQGGGTT